MEFNKFFGSHAFRSILIGVGITLVALLIFEAGVIVGFHKASFSYRWGENYHRNFGGPERGFLMRARGGDFSNSHGTFGKIISIELPSITVEGSDAVEKKIIVKDDTAINQFKNSIKAADLKVGDHIVVIGEPNSQGQIEAKLIRVLPSPGTFIPQAPNTI